MPYRLVFKPNQFALNFVVKNRCALF